MAKEYGRYPLVESVFLQDADSLLLPTADLLEILKHLKQKFPDIKRVTSYARAKTLKRKSVEELKELKAAGLTKIHTGMESGSATVLKLTASSLSPKAWLILIDVVFWTRFHCRVPSHIVFS